MPKAPPADVPPDVDLDGLRTAASACTACYLAGPATQTVFGEGAAHARVVFVGEQPGDQEDRAGRPFVGPAGRLLDEALVDPRIDPQQVLITHPGQHLRVEPAPGGTQRLHRTPTVTQVRICAPWLQAELGRIRPELVVALGATAAKALRGQDFRITTSRGQLLDAEDHRFLATAHPAAVLRADDRDEAYRLLVDDLRVAAGALSEH